MVNMTALDKATIQAMQKNADRDALRSYRNRQRMFDYQVGRLEYYERFLPAYVAAFFWLFAFVAFLYLGIQVWAYSVTHVLHLNYTISTLCVMLGGILIGNLIVKLFERPTNVY